MKANMNIWMRVSFGEFTATLSISRKFWRTLDATRADDAPFDEHVHQRCRACPSHALRLATRERQSATAAVLNFPDYSVKEE